MEIIIRDRNFGEIRGNKSNILSLLNEYSHKDYFLTQILEGKKILYKNETAANQHKISENNGKFQISTRNILNKADIEAVKLLKASVFVGKFINQVNLIK